ncbi:MAG: type IV secretion system DNA-binding domain-containing protein [Patescibacteria group bacterium]|nr:type IV secretion system DNA-binding domain-containing protein [Patescibacteria group bacterium]
MNNKDITYFAEANFRNKHQRFGIKRDDRTKHVYVIGKTGMGKSTMLENMAVQDIQNGEGMAFIDPHGATAELLLDYVPEDRIDDVIYFAPFDTEYPISFNVLEDVGYDKRHLVVAGLMSTFEKIWVDAWSARMSYILSNTLLALLEYPNSTLMSINRMLADKEYRKKVVDNITDPTVKSFWVDEFAKYTDRYTQEATPAIQNKIGQFTSNPLIRNIIGQPRTSFDLRKLMDEKKIIIINLSKGRLGEQNANLLGSMLITKIYLAAMSRADVSSEELKKLPQFYFYVDEFQSFANKSFADILSEARKYKLNLTIAHQYIEQMSEEVNAAVFGNVGTMIVFRVGAYDADILEKEFAPEFIAQDIVNLGFTQIYLRLMINGVGSRPFSASTLPPIAKLEHSFKDKIIEASRKNYAIPRKTVEDMIKRWHEDGAPTVLSKPGSIMAKKDDKPFEKKPVFALSADKRIEQRLDNKKPYERKYVKPTISLNALKEKSGENVLINNKNRSHDQRSHPQKASANLSALREALNEIAATGEPKEKNKSGILKPGQKIKFD